MKSRIYRYAAVINMLFLLLSVNAIAIERSSKLPTITSLIGGEQNEYVEFKKTDKGFPISANGIATAILVHPNDFQGVQVVVDSFCIDVFRVANCKPEMLNQIPSNKKEIIIVGTLGNSPFIDQLVSNGSLSVDDLEGKWETSLIEVIEHPFPNISRALVIVGSDKRGTMYGLFDVSRKMGVSPWYWWADVPVGKHANVYIKKGRYNLGEPKVRYRGIFLNDEEPALGRWAVMKYGGFNHQFHSQLFDLMLRLKCNYLWPAMWWASFNTDDPENTRLADKMGIVMGTTHHEPMNRAHAEWKAGGKGKWNYETNKDELQKFWREGIERIGNSEVIINMAMRGDGDEAMSAETNIELLKKIVADQRQIISEVTGKEISKVPQMWALYKEVQDYYDKGMTVPDDITLLLCDDNWGNIRKLPRPEAKARSGGYGIYYHFDYVGGPRNYKWVNTSPVPRVWEQMNMAYNHGVTQLWLVNVGDLKPMEYPITFWCDFAWNPEAIDASELPAYSHAWAAEQFGTTFSEEISGLVEAYTKFNGRRKPELLTPETYSLINFREAETTINEYNQLKAKAELVKKQLSAEFQDAFYQLVYHPIEACANLNELYYSVALNRLYASQKRSLTNNMAEKVEVLFAKDKSITDYYHTQLSGGKWNNMMSQTHIGYTYWQQPEKNVMPEVATIQLQSGASMGVAIEGSTESWPGSITEAILPITDPFQEHKTYFEIFNRGLKPFSFQAKSTEMYVELMPSEGEVTFQSRIELNIDWEKAPIGETKIPITIKGSEGTEIVLMAVIQNYREVVSGFVESRGVIAIESEHFSRNSAGESARWELIPGLGNTLSAMHPVPVNSSAQVPLKGAPVLEYDIYLFSKGEVTVKSIVSPTLNIYNDEGLEFAISIDEQEPKVVNIHHDFSFHDWEEAVKNNSITIKSVHQLGRAGKHTLKIWMIDPGVVLQKLIIETKENKYTYLGPPESRFIQK